MPPPSPSPRQGYRVARARSWDPPRTDLYPVCRPRAPEYQSSHWPQTRIQHTSMAAVKAEGREDAAPCASGSLPLPRDSQVTLGGVQPGWQKGCTGGQGPWLPEREHFPFGARLVHQPSTDYLCEQEDTYDLTDKGGAWNETRHEGVSICTVLDQTLPTNEPQAQEAQYKKESSANFDTGDMHEPWIEEVPSPTRRACKNFGKASRAAEDPKRYASTEDPKLLWRPAEPVSEPAARGGRQGGQEDIWQPCSWMQVPYVVSDDAQQSSSDISQSHTSVGVNPSDFLLGGNAEVKALRARLVEKDVEQMERQKREDIVYYENASLQMELCLQRGRLAESVSRFEETQIRVDALAAENAELHAEMGLLHSRLGESRVHVKETAGQRAESRERKRAMKDADAARQKRPSAEAAAGGKGGQGCMPFLGRLVCCRSP